MISTILMTPHEMSISIARKAQARRLSLNLSQKTLSERSGVSYGVIKKFERTGKISIESLLKMALILEAFEEFDNLFPEKTPQQFTSLEALLKEKKRKRGRK